MKNVFKRVFVGFVFIITSTIPGLTLIGIMISIVWKPYIFIPLYLIPLCYYLGGLKD